MRITRDLLRAAARRTLESNGYQVVVKIKRGVAPGARLRITKGLGDQTVAVKTSLKRKIGLMRTDNGVWRTIPDVDQVVIAVPAILQDVRSRFLALRRRISWRLLMPPRGTKKGWHPDRLCSCFWIGCKSKSKQSTAGLKGKAKWAKTIPLDEKSLASMKIFTGQQNLIERFKHDLAELHGVEVGKIQIEIRINA